MKKRKLIVMSNDALVYEDLKILENMPELAPVFREGAVVRHVRTIYPSVTYPCHVSIASGCYPDKTGIVSNAIVKPGCCGPKPWQWFHDSVKCRDIFDAAKTAGLTTGAVFWPVTGNHPAIDWLVDEYWPQSENDDMRDVFLRSGTSEELWERVVSHYVKGCHIRKHPETNYLIMDCACDIIKYYQPDLLMIHPANIDAARHHSGVFSDLVTDAVRSAGEWMVRIITATKNAGTFEDTVFAFVSDHGQLNITRRINLNVLLKEAGLIDVDENGEVTDWRAWSHSVGLSAQIYLKDPEDADTLQKVENVLKQAVSRGVYGMERYYTKQQAEEEEHLAGDFSFVVETDGYTSFADDWKEPLVHPMDLSDYRYGKATHGHNPSKGPQPPMILWGPGIKKGAVLDRCNLVDEAPTFADILGVSLPDADGRSLRELLEEE